MENNRGLVNLKICSKDIQALADMGGTYNLIPTRLVKEVGLISTMENWTTYSWNLAVGLIQDVPVQMGRWRGQLNFIVINTDGVEVMLGREGIIQLSQAMEQDEVADQEEEVMMAEGVEDLTMIEVGLEGDQTKPESCSSWTWTDEGTHMEGPCNDEDMMKAELEINQVESRSCSLTAWIDEDTYMGRPHDEDLMEVELEIDQVEPGSCSEVTHMEEPHVDKVSVDTCVSFGHLGDELCAGRGKVSFPRQEDILPWMAMMEPCMEEQGLMPV